MSLRWDRLAVIALVLSQFGLAACEKAKEGGRAEQPQRPQRPLAAMDWSQVDRALGKAGAMQPGDVYKVGLPRSDLHVSVGAVAVKPALALGSWVAFRQTADSEAVVMGDLVLLENEVAPVMSKLEEGGIRPTALHNHLLHESPHVLYMHIMGRGAPATLATGIHAALALTTTPLTAPVAPPAAATPLGLDTTQIAQAVGYQGKVNGGVYQIAVPRADTVTLEGMNVPPAMGVATAINFQPTGGGKAAVTGDFVLIAAEVNPVIQALRASDIEVTALHSHMLGESPRLFFMHFWANDDAVKLARGLGTALTKMNVRKAG
jgi:uncharacterized protein DUF1259